MKMDVQAETLPSIAERRSSSFRAPTLIELAHEALTACGNDADAAEDVMFNQILKDKELLRMLVRSAVRSASNSAIGKVLTAQRAAAIASIGAAVDKPAVSSAQTAKDKSRAKALAAVVKLTILDLPLSDGTLLREATVDQIRASAARWRAQGETMLHRAKFLELVAAVVPVGKTAGAVLTDARAAALYRKAA
jgi:hypothetical protein